MNTFLKEFEPQLEEVEALAGEFGRVRESIKEDVLLVESLSKQVETLNNTNSELKPKTG